MLKRECLYRDFYMKAKEFIENYEDGEIFKIKVYMLEHSITFDDLIARLKTGKELFPHILFHDYS